MIRESYLITTNENSDRVNAAKTVLSEVGFHINVIKALPRSNDEYHSKMASNRNTMLYIVDEIGKKEGNDFYYIFEDDVNVLKPVKLDEIIEYENISRECELFYLGCCRYNYTFDNTIETEHCIRGNTVYKVTKFIRGTHAFAMTPNTARKMCDFFMTNEKILEESDVIPFDIMLEMYVHECTNGVMTMRHELESNVKDHFGLFFQDRNRFPSIIGTY